MRKFTFTYLTTNIVAALLLIFICLVSFLCTPVQDTPITIKEGEIKKIGIGRYILKTDSCIIIFSDGRQGNSNHIDATIFDCRKDNVHIVNNN